MGDRWGVARLHTHQGVRCAAPGRGLWLAVHPALPTAGVVEGHSLGSGLMCGGGVDAVGFLCLCKSRCPVCWSFPEQGTIEKKSGEVCTWRGRITPRLFCAHGSVHSTGTPERPLGLPRVAGASSLLGGQAGREQARDHGGHVHGLSAGRAARAHSAGGRRRKWALRAEQ